MLQVHDIGLHIAAFQSTYNFCIGDKFFGRIKKDQVDNHGLNVRNSTFSVICGKRKKEFMCILCVGNEKDGSASLFTSNCYIFDPHSRNSYGLYLDSGTSILVSFKTRKICYHIFI